MRASVVTEGRKAPQAIEERHVVRKIVFSRSGCPRRKEDKVVRDFGLGRRWVRVFVIWLACLGLGLPLSGAHPPQETLPAPPAEEQVAQLFLVALPGTTLDDETPLAQLLKTWPLAGVVLLPSEQEPLLERDRVVDLVWKLQSQAFDVQKPREVRSPHRERSEPFVPLLIGMEQLGNGVPYDTLAFPATLPSPMAVAATWNPDLARAVGHMMGRELQAWGVNLLLGPYLDVLDPTFLGQPGDLGIRSFGENPYWVSRMARAYIEGLHQGAEGRLLVVGRTFPGYGGAARPLEEEIPSVPLTREQMEASLLAPYLHLAQAVHQAPGRGVVDAFLVGHIRYAAFQGTIRAETPPLSLDPQALQGLQNHYAPLKAWYEEPYHVFMSMDLGAPSLKRYYQAQDAIYDPVQVALSAFLAGNDLLYLGPGFHAAGEDYAATVEVVLQAFARKYREDPLFQQRVDASVERTRQFRLQVGNSLSDVLPDRTTKVTLTPQEENVLLQVARSSATLLVPADEEALPPPPSKNENILILVDPAPWSPCPECEPLFTFSGQEFRTTLLRLYGPEGRDQVLPGRVQTFTASQVRAWMEDPQDPALENLDRALRTAPWVVVLLADVQGPNAQTLLRLLEDFPELWRDRRVVVFSFHVPYALQPSHLAHVSAYYGLYSKGRPYLDIAARLLFRELRPEGASPVSIPALGYNLSEVLQPNPVQNIPLVWKMPGQKTPPAEKIQVEAGTTLTVEAGPILDHNGHPVPDGTLVQFVLSLKGSDAFLQKLEALTSNGYAQAAFILDRPGTFVVKAQSGKATESDQLVVEVVPTPTPAPTPFPSPSPVPTPQPTLHPPLVATPPEPSDAGWGTTLSALGWAFSWSLAMALWHWFRHRKPRMALRSGLFVLTCALWAYNGWYWWQGPLSPTAGVVVVAEAALLAGLVLYLLELRYAFRS